MGLGLVVLYPPDTIQIKRTTVLRDFYDLSSTTNQKILLGIFRGSTYLLHSFFELLLYKTLNALTGNYIILSYNNPLS
jgi:hypothetical protein